MVNYKDFHHMNELMRHFFIVILKISKSNKYVLTESDIYVICAFEDSIWLILFL